MSHHQQNLLFCINVLHHVSLCLHFICSVMSVGFAWINYGPESLSQVGLVEGILTMVFADLAETSQLRIKPIIRILRRVLFLSASVCLHYIMAYDMRI